MKTKLLFFVIFQIYAGFLFAQKFEKTTDKNLLPNIILYESGRQENVYISAKSRAKSAKEAMSVFEVTYTGFSDEAKAAFQAAVDIWSQILSSPVPITIDARWEVMDQGILGGSSSPELFRNFKNAPFKDTWYKPTIANRLAGYDLSPEGYDMIIRYNSTANWYLGTDGNPGTKTDLLSVVLHEIGHGLGFSAGAWKDGTSGGIGYVDENGENQSFVAFDHFMFNGDGEQLIDTNIFKNPSTDLLAQFQSNDIYFDSPLANEANGGVIVELYAPTTWNQGSSISHLAESFNGTENALMTYSIGTGEALHDPGPITMGMFADLGWVSVRFDHKALKDIETWTTPRTVSAELYADTSLYDNSVKLHYSVDQFKTDDNIVLMTTTNDTLFNADIPVIANDTVWYYIEAKSKLDRFYFYPSQGTGNISTTFNDSSFYFISGVDNIKPTIMNENENKYIFDVVKLLEISASADDNIGIDSMYIEYKINENTAKYLNLKFDHEDITGTPIYSTELPLYDETLQNGDTLYYKIHAVDSSSNTNSAFIPANGYYKIPVHEIYAPVKDTVIDFDNANAEDIFVLDGFTVDQPTNFDSKALHSPHPYEEGQNYKENEINYVAILQIPIILDDDSTKITFDEIVIVEPGTAGTVFGDAEFWDYVIIEGSKDTGKTWKEFDIGYDCSISTAFTSAFNSTGNGEESMYLNHKIDLLQNGNFNAGDTILIRFRLWSDPAAVGWGWAVDNIQIQKDGIVPTTPGSLATTEITDTTISLIWNKSTDNDAVAGYLVYQNDILVDQVTDTTYKATDLSHATQYSYFVKATDATNNLSEKSNTVVATTTNITSVNIFSNHRSEMKVYPNPASNYINIEYRAEDNINVAYLSIYSLDGKLISSISKSVMDNSFIEQINIGELKSGYYFIRLTLENKVITERFIIK
ncbi:MAG TPA: hypothetical protein DCG75_18180 [Bacteroidales bacterium]|nr:hypothetical protein [Bacteroidales bacterium]